VERVELDLDGVDVEVPDEAVVEAVEVTGVVDAVEDVVDEGEDEEDVTRVEVGDEDEEDEPELELPLLTSNRDTGKVGVCPSVAFGPLLQPALIASRARCALSKMVF
jgi:hypothetical protein